ncbi:hypothetical protein C7K25_04260 [Gulosibacter molinativorax]|uniref:Uncharacterized protein n=1 Tax=Gulosibacter molinativorax TaxID=256821 RepID=A0ABT7C5W6_9MICO|nr:hypothetical protein [Gulosibacter molinativorax]
METSREHADLAGLWVDERSARAEGWGILARSEVGTADESRMQGAEPVDLGGQRDRWGVNELRRDGWPLGMLG